MDPPPLTRRALGHLLSGAACAAIALQRRSIAGPAASRSASGNPWHRDFPALHQRIDGHPLAYLDSAATTQRPAAVVEALLDYYRRDNANPGAKFHALARRAQDRYESARRTVARFLNAGGPDELVWVRGTTEAINLVASTWVPVNLRPGDEILLTVAEHASNLLPWRIAAERARATLRFTDTDDQGRIDLADFDRKLSARTRLVAFSHVSNVVGYVNPAADICARARRAGARVLIDAAQSAPHVALDVQALGCDFLALSSHKMLGPMGVGVLWARQELLEAMPPYQAGSNMAHEVDLQGQQLEHGAHKFGAGTPNVAGAVGLAAAIAYIESVGRGAIHEHEQALTAYALDRLREVEGLRVLGPLEPGDRVPLFSFAVAGVSSSEVLQFLDARGIAIRAGDLAARPLLSRFRVESAARASCYLYTRKSDIDELITALHALPGRLK